MIRTYDITVNIKVDAETADDARAFVRESIDCAYIIEEVEAMEDDDDHS